MSLLPVVLALFVGGLWLSQFAPDSQGRKWGHSFAAWAPGLFWLESVGGAFRIPLVLGLVLLCLWRVKFIRR